MGKRNLLDLDTLYERPTVNIRSSQYPGGRLWEMRVRDELSPLQLQKIYKRGVRGQELSALMSDDIESLKPNEVQELQDCMDEVLKIAFVDDVVGTGLLGELSLEHKVAIISAFTEACLTPEGQATTNRATASTGA